MPDTAKTLEMSQQNKDPCHDGAYSACVWEGAGSTHQHNNEHVVRLEGNEWYGGKAEHRKRGGRGAQGWRVS